MRRIRSSWLTALGLLSVLLLVRGTPPMAAQNVYSAIHGTVTDSSGAVIPSATVTVLNTSTGISTVKTADEKGYYIFPQLQVGGPYTVTVSAPGFEKFSSAGLNLNVNDNRDLDAVLRVGGTSQTVEVAATAVQVDTSDTQFKQVVTSDQLEQIPLEGRDPAGLQKLQTGVVESSDRFGNFSSNGSQTAQNSYLVNGTDINDPTLQNEGIQVNPDALSEENIVTSTLNPEFSRNSGAVINQVIKSGTNSLHGSGFEFYRDTFLNNGSYFSATRPQFHQNLYGGTLGGPLLRNKLFFFTGYQGLRNKIGLTTLSQTMSPGQLSGQFAGDLNYATGGMNSAGLTTNKLPFNIGNCTAGETWAQCFPGGNVTIPSTEWNPLAAKVIQQFVPASNYTAGGVSYYDFNAGDTAAQDQGIIRLDYTPTTRDSIWASTIFQSSPATFALPFGGSSFPGFEMVQTEHFKIFSTSYTHTFSSSTLNELRGSYYRLNFPNVIPATVIQPGSYGFSINPQLTQASLPYMAIGALFDLGFSFEGPQPRTDTNTTFADNFSWVKGNHSLKFGASFEQFRVANPFGYLNNGYYSYAGGTEGGGLYSSGDPLVDFVMGIPDSYEQTSDGLVNALASERYAYAQDNWKISNTFTFNYGIAWDAEQPFQNKQFGGVGVICYQVSSATSKIFPGGPPGLLYPGDPGCNAAGGVTTRYNHFGPRIGFAWSPTSGPSRLIGSPGAHQFSVRGGIGVYFNRDQEEQSLDNLTDPPFLYTSRGAGDFGGSPSFANPFADVAGNGSEPNPYPYSVPAPGSSVNWSIYNLLSMSAFDKNYSVPYVYNFNLNVQRSLPSNIVMQLGYVGSMGRRLATWYEGDPITPAGHAACLAGSVPAGFPSQLNCNSGLAGSIHQYFPQFTAQPAVVPGTGGGAVPQLPNGVPWFLSIGDQNTEGTSNYNSFQASVIKSPTHGLLLTFAYTWAHSLDDGSGYESVTGGQSDGNYGNFGRVRIYTPGFEYLNYGDSDFDARQRFATSYVYSVPVSGILKSNPFLREALSGWELAGVTAFQTGFPVSISQGQDRSLWCDGNSFFNCGDVPMTSSFHIKTSDPRSSSDHRWFDTSSFSPEPIGTYGNVKRNFFHGPGFNYTNFQFSKNFAVNTDGSRYVQLRLEAFNAFNHANFGPPSGQYTSPSFGLVTNVIESAEPNSDPQPGRAVQLAGKFYF